MVNKITAIYNLATKKWSITKDLKPTKDVVFNLGFEKDGHDMITFNNLKFGFKLWRITDPRKTDMVGTRDFPFGKTKQYLRSENKILEIVDDLEISPADDFRIELYAEESGERSEFNYEFLVPLPAQPYPSWAWNGVFWEAPKQLPVDHEVVEYRWDESKLEWISDIADPSLALKVASDYGAVDTIVTE